MRTAITALLALHGAIHIMGLLKWSRLAAVPQLTGRTLLPLSNGASWAFALLWLATFSLLLAGAALRAVRGESWWIAAAAGVLLSQCLIVFAWHDAKFGTLANLVILLPVVAAAAHARFERRIDAEVRALLAPAAASSPAPIVTREELAPLPAPVRKWLVSSGVVGRARARSVRLKQRGQLRTAPDAAWMPAEAEQYFTIAKPAFVWRVDATMMGFLPIAGRDRYAGGSGHMLIKAASLLNVVDASDERIASGALLRFLGEIVWFPSAALSPNVSWDAVDSSSARATLRDAGLTASAVFTFSPEGRVLRLNAERYLGGGAKAQLTPWVVSCSQWRVIRGVEIPTHGDVGWKLPGGDFSYYRWEILDLEYDRPEAYQQNRALPSQPNAGLDPAPSAGSAT
jgi:hypothetical protein